MFQKLKMGPQSTILLMGGLALAYHSSLAQSPEVGAMRFHRPTSPPAQVSQISRKITPRSERKPEQVHSTYQVEKAKDQKQAVAAATAQEFRTIVREYYRDSPELAAQVDRVANALGQLSAEVHGADNERGMRIDKLETALRDLEKRDNTIAAVVEVTSNPAQVIQQISQVMTSPMRTLVVFEDTAGKRTQDTGIVETGVTQALQNINMRVFDYDYGRRISRMRLPAFDAADNTTQAALLARSLFAQYVALGRVSSRLSQNNGGIISYRAHCELRFVDALGGETAYRKTFDSKGFGREDAQANENALTNLAEEVGKALEQELARRLNATPRKIQLRLEDGKDMANIVMKLKSVPGFSEVSVKTTGAQTLFEITSQDRPASALEHIASILKDDTLLIDNTH